MTPHGKKYKMAFYSCGWSVTLQMPVSCKNGSRVQLLIPFTCYGRLKISLVQKITNFLFFAFLKLFSVHQKRMSTSSTERRFNRIRNSARENNKPILPVILNLTLPTVNHQKFGNNTKRTVKNQKTKNVTFSMNKRHFHFIHCKMKTLKICCH